MHAFQDLHSRLDTFGTEDCMFDRDGVGEDLAFGRTLGGLKVEAGRALNGGNPVKEVTAEAVQVGTDVAHV